MSSVIEVSILMIGVIIRTLGQLRFSKLRVLCLFPITLRGGKCALRNGCFLSTQIELIDRVDDIYRNTSWDNAGFKGYGVQIEQVLTHRGGSCSW